MKAINVNKITASGGVFIFWVADWFALLNNKMGGDLEKIRVVGRYFVEVWKAVGMNLQNVQFLWASEEINKRAEEYWSTVIDISRKFNLTRIKKCGQIMGRGEGDELKPVGNTVDLETGRYTNDIGATHLATIWTDPDFEPSQRAFYYTRVLQIPTPRHTLLDAIALQIEHEEGYAKTIQERAYTSPIWYTP